MKTFGDLQPGDYIHELDLLSGIYNKYIVNKTTNKSVTFSNSTIWPNMNSSRYIASCVQYFCNKDECIDALNKLLKFHLTRAKQIRNIIKQLE